MRVFDFTQPTLEDLQADINDLTDYIYNLEIIVLSAITQFTKAR